jgi:transcriptional regulator with XRE-family HTH domain
MDIARNVKRLRLRCGLSQRVLAQRTKVSAAFIGQLETGTSNNPTLATLRRLAKALKVTVAELVQ